MNSVTTVAIPPAGAEADVARVVLAPEIVPLLSAQLYQSPLKAIEELVVNSYDADAKNCFVYISSSSVAVSDDGIGMDLGALKNLWNVGRSVKRSDEAYLKLVSRKQIGKFGIGKLAAYSIARKISYYTKNGNDILHATLDFQQFDGQKGIVEVPIYRLRTEDNATEHLFDQLRQLTGNQLSFFSNKSWTICLLTELGPKAATIQQGRLNWVLSTAMPIGDGFRLFLQGKEIKSAKESSPPVVSFDVNSFPSERIDELEKRLKTDLIIKDGRIFTPALKLGVAFSAQVYSHIISTGKSVDLTRSHGFFVRVRGRLINERDELFGLTPQSYKTWNRFRAVVDANDLDEEITASRESVEESESVAQVREIVGQIFAESRSRYEAWESKTFEAEKAKKEEGRNPVSPRLVEIPIADTVSRFGTQHSGAEADSDWFYIDFGETPDPELLKTLYGPREGVYSYRYEDLGVNERMVKFQPAEKLFVLNEKHPLVREYKDEDKASERLLQDFVTAEALLEVYLREAGVPIRIIGELLEERDKLIRSLARDQIYSLTSIADELRRASDQQYDLEISLVAAARALGFIAKHVGGSGMPDGVARYIDNNNKETLITLEAKSSTGTPTLAAIDFAGIDEHIKKEKAAGALVVAPSYPGFTKGDLASAANRAKEIQCSCWTVEQLAQVVAAAESREISAKDVLNIVLHSYSPDDVSAAILKLLTDPEVTGTEIYTSAVDAMEELLGRQLGKPLNVDMVLTAVSQTKRVTADQVLQAVRVVAKASKGLIRLSADGSEISVLGSFDELRRRLGDLIHAPISARRLGSFRDNGAK